MKHLRFIVILIIQCTGLTSAAKPITQLIYEDVKNKKCLEPSTEELKKVKALCALKDNIQDQKKMNQEALDEITEHTVFSNLIDQEILKTKCAIEKQKWILQNNDYLNKAIISACEKMPQLKTNLLEIEKLNNQISGLEKTLDSTVRIVPDDYRSKTELEIKKLNKINSLYAADVQNIKDTQILFKSDGLYQTIHQQLTGEGLLTFEKSADQSCQYLHQNTYELLNENLNKMTKSVNELSLSQKNHEISQALKEQLWQSNSGFELRSWIQKDESSLLINGLTCRMESRFGEGVKIRYKLLNIGSLAVGGASYFSARLVAELSAINISSPVLIGRSLAVAEAAGNVSLASYIANEHCQTQITPTTKKSCIVSDKTIQAELDQNQCLYAVASGLITAGFVGLGIKQNFVKTVETLPVLQKFKMSDQEIKINPQIAIWKYKEVGEFKKAEELRKMYLDKMQNSSFKITGNLGAGDIGGNFIEFEDGTKGVWKSVSRDSSNNLVGKETAAYRIDRYLEIDQVPMTVERELNGRRGIVQMRINDVDKIKYTKQPENYSFYDSLIGNHDRINDANVMSYQRRPIAIDHEKAFNEFKRSNPFSLDVNDVNHQLRFAETESERRIAVSRLKAILPSQTTFEKLKLTSEDQWKKMLSDSLNKTQLNNFLDGRKKVIDVIEKQIELHGEDIFRDGVMSPVMKIKPSPAQGSAWD